MTQCMQQSMETSVLNESSQKSYRQPDGWNQILTSQYRGFISVFATAALGTLGSVQMMSVYGVPNMDRFTLASLMSGTAQCGTDEDGCWASLATVVGMLYAGTLLISLRVDFC